MAFFPRRTKVPTSPPDAAFPFWDAATADEFRATVRQTLAASGSEVQVFADHVVQANGTQLGLANLAASCHQDERGRRAWPEIITNHISLMIAAMSAPKPFETMTSQQILDSTYLRVMPTSDLLPTMRYARTIAPGLSQVFNLDLPTTVQYFTDDQVQLYGYDALYEAVA